jgi:hypothetical protein
LKKAGKRGIGPIECEMAGEPMGKKSISMAETANSAKEVWFIIFHPEHGGDGIGARGNAIAGGSENLLQPHLIVNSLALREAALVEIEDGRPQWIPAIVHGYERRAHSTDSDALNLVRVNCVPLHSGLYCSAKGFPPDLWIFFGPSWVGALDGIGHPLEGMKNPSLIHDADFQALRSDIGPQEQSHCM